jgi:LysM repeat protein
MKLPFKPPKKKTLMASTARRPREADFTEEPNVRLSSAFVVVLVLHVVAVGGIYAFNALKAHQPSGFDETEAPQPAAQTVAPVQSDSPASPAPGQSTATYYRVKSGDTIARIAAAYGVGAEDLIDLNGLRAAGGIHVGQELKIPAGGTVSEEQDAPKPVALRDSGMTYTVVRGDTPASIARKLHVGYDDLIRLNKIEDPKKLKIGLKLKVPVKRPAASLI